MRCPKCGCSDDKVIDSRSLQDGSGVRRRRECTQCQYRFTTIESIVPEGLKVIKRNGVREEYSREKLESGIKNACYKRPVSDEQIESAVAEITRSLLRDFDKEVPSREIGERVMNSLKALDQVAFVRFASVYRQFQAAKDFISEVKGLKK